MEDGMSSIEIRASMCRTLDRWDSKLRGWDDNKILNRDGVVEVTALSVRNILDFRPETDYWKRWLLLDIIVAYAKLYGMNNYVCMGQLYKRWPCAAKHYAAKDHILIPILDKDGKHWMMLDVQPESSGNHVKVMNSFNYKLFTWPHLSHSEMENILQFLRVSGIVSESCSVDQEFATKVQRGKEDCGSTAAFHKKCELRL